MTHLPATATASHPPAAWMTHPPVTAAASHSPAWPSHSTCNSPTSRHHHYSPDSCTPLWPHLHHFFASSSFPTSGGPSGRRAGSQVLQACKAGGIGCLISPSLLPEGPPAAGKEEGWEQTKPSLFPSHHRLARTLDQFRVGRLRPPKQVGIASCLLQRSESPQRGWFVEICDLPEPNCTSLVVTRITSGNQNPACRTPQSSYISTVENEIVNWHNIKEVVLHFQNYIRISVFTRYKKVIRRRIRQRTRLSINYKFKEHSKYLITDINM